MGLRWEAFSVCITQGANWGSTELWLRDFNRNYVVITAKCRWGTASAHKDLATVAVTEGA